MESMEAEIAQHRPSSENTPTLLEEILDFDVTTSEDEKDSDIHHGKNGKAPIQLRCGVRIHVGEW
jgi:hypothetical protein